MIYVEVINKIIFGVSQYKKSTGKFTGLFLLYYLTVQYLLRMTTPPSSNVVLGLISKISLALSLNLWMV